MLSWPRRLEEAVSNFILLLLCFSAGMVLRRTRKLPENAHQALNTIVIYIALPAMTLLYLHRFTFSHELAFAAMMPWYLLIIAAVFFYCCRYVFGISRESAGALTLVAGLGNTSFVGIPLVEALHGEAGIPIALVIDQAGSYLALSTVGAVIVAMYASEKNSARQIAAKILSFPPFLALCAAFILMDVHYPLWFEDLLRKLAALVAPLALISVGYQLRFDGFAGHLKALSLGLGYKLVVCPIIVTLAYMGIGMPFGTTAVQVTLLESAMGPMIGAGVVASQNRLDPKLVALMIGIGIPMSVLSVTAYSKLLTIFAM